LLKLNLLLASTVSAVDWDLFDRITNKKVLHLADDVRARHCKKVMQLQKTQHPTGPPAPVRQSSTSAECHLLSPEQRPKLRGGPRAYPSQGFPLWHRKVYRDPA
jgi:hypothetical protein